MTGKGKQARKGTETSDFGVSKREGHDASKFYGTRMYRGLSINEKQPVIDTSASIDARLFTKAINFDAVAQVPAYAVHLAMIIIPATIGSSKEKINDALATAQGRIAAIARTLATGGRLVVIVDNRVPATISPSSYLPLHANIALSTTGNDLFMRGEIIMVTRCPTPPGGMEKSHVLQGDRGYMTSTHLHALVFSKHVSRRLKKDDQQGIERTDTISRDDFLACTKSVWTVNETGIPAVLPRLAELYSYKEDVLLLACAEEEKNSKALLGIRPRTILVAW